MSLFAKTFALVALSTALLFGQPTSLAGDTFKLDPVHSSLLFKVKHLGVSYSYGRFNEMDGQIVWDSADPSKSTFSVTVKTSSVDTANAKRDEHLRSPDFFDAKQFPTLSFKSTSVKPAGENKYEVTGDLTIRGVTKPITVTLEHVGVNSGQRGTKTGFDGQFTINRQDFGVAYMPQGIGNDVTILVALEADKQ